MFGCCCKSSGSRTTIIAALVGAAGVLGGSLVTKSLDAAPPVEPVTEQVSPAGVVPTSFQPEGEMDPDAMMEAMKAMAEPVAEHEMLAHMAGTWDCEAKFYMAGPDAPPTVSKGVSHNKLVMGGRYVVQHFEMADFMGGDFEGMGFVGFDRATGQYVNNWIDNWSTGIMTMTGEHHEDSHTMEWRGSWQMATPDGPMEMPAHHIIKHTDDDHFVMEFWEADPASGEEHMGGQISYTRRK